MVYWVEGEEAHIILDARADVDGTAVLLHSRGGATGGQPPRNPDYQRALRLLLRRAAEPGVISRIAIDSSEAQKVPVEHRTIFDGDELSDFDPEDLALEVGRRLAAWPLTPDEKPSGNRTKRVRIETPHIFVAQRFRLRKKGPGHSKPRQIQRHEFDRLSKAHLDDAIEALLSGSVEPDFGSTTDYSILLDDGTKLPPKTIVGLALEGMLGEPVNWRQFRGGKDTPAFAVLREHGFTIIHERADELAAQSPKIDPPEAVEEALGGQKLSEEDKTFVEGSVKRASHLRRERNSELIATFKAAILRDHGKFRCERCDRDWIDEYGPEVAKACFEAHHAVTQVAEMNPGHESKPEDLQLLCANCHRAVHREMKLGVRPT